MLRDLEILVLDGQASGANPAHGDLLELGWGFVGPDGVRGVKAYWIRPRTERPVPRPIRRLLEWDEACLATAIDGETAWRELLADATPGMPALIHWARFERPFLDALHGEPAPFDVRCLHAISERLFEGLPKKNLRALAGHLGHSASLVRRARGHVEATAHVWRAIVPRLEREGVTTWADLDAFLARPVSRTAKIVFPYPQERRRMLPDAPGVYRFARSNGDILYVGKASSIKQRVARHFSTRPSKDDSLEMLSQVADVSALPTETALDAALLEVDEIHRCDPPYNLQLRLAERRAWFSSRDFDDVQHHPDALHPVGPLPSRRAVAGLAAMNELLAGREPAPELRAAAVGAPPAFAPERDVFDEAWGLFAPKVALLAAARALHPLSEEEAPDDAGDAWTVDRVRRHLARTLAGEGLLVRRARLLCLLLDARIAFRDGGRDRRLDAPAGRLRSLQERRRSFDARSYDRMRVLVTELRRVHLEGGGVTLEVGSHRLDAANLFSSV